MSRRFRSLPRGAPDWLVRKRALMAENAKWPRQLKPVPEQDWPPSPRSAGRTVGAWRSATFMVCAFRQGAAIRLEVNRTDVDIGGKWLGRITRDELLRLLAEAGFADRYALEIFAPGDEPDDDDSVRQLLVLPKRPAFLPREKRT